MNDFIYPTHKPLDYGSKQYYWQNSSSLRCVACGKVFNSIYTTYTIDDQLKAYKSFYGGLSDQLKAEGITKPRKIICRYYLPGKHEYLAIHFTIPVFKGVGKKVVASHHCLRLKLWDTSKHNTPHLLMHGWDTIHDSIKDNFANG